MGQLMIYGATGYTGHLASEYAKKFGLGFVLAGRTAHKLQSFASSLDLPYRTFGIHGSCTAINSTIGEISIVLNCAGPFRHTARPLIEACIHNGIHYFDIAAELDSYEHAQELDL